MEIDLFVLNYEAESQLEGVPTQAVILLQPEAKPLPISVFLMATQKTRATKTTINVYSTKPWPSSSTSNRLKSSLIWFHPLSYSPVHAFCHIQRSTRCAVTLDR